jgi:Predicted DNA-binding protein with an HTH domain
MLTIELPIELENRLDALAQATGRSKSDYVTEAILEYLEDLADLHLAEQRLRDIQNGKSKTVPLEEVLKRYGMEN